MEYGRRDGMILWRSDDKTHYNLYLCPLPSLLPVFLRSFALEDRAGMGGHVDDQELKFPINNHRSELGSGTHQGIRPSGGNSLGQRPHCNL